MTSKATKKFSPDDKAEVIRRRRHWHSFEAAELATLTWLNNRQRLEPIGKIPPANAKQRCQIRPIAQIIASAQNKTAPR